MEAQAKKPAKSLITSSERPVLVDFWAPWCGPCTQIAPMVEGVAEEFGGRINFVKVNVEEEPELAAQYQVMSLPTLMMFRDGEPVDALVGGVSRDTIASLVNNALTAGRI